MKKELILAPLPFHDALAGALRTLEPGLWKWFASDALGERYANDVRLELLRATYRLPRDDNAAYGVADEIREALGVDAPLTLYQAQDDGPMNAALVFVPGEAHVVLRGPVLSKLTERELRALLGHELAHHKLWTASNGDYRIAGALIEDMARRGNATSHVQSAVRLRLWTEIYADRAGLLACDDLPSAVACLVKVSTGLERVDGAAYLDQAREALAGANARAAEKNKKTKSGGVTHPETFLRAFALESWANGGDFAEIEALIAGPTELDTLDLVQQRALTATTERVVGAILAPAVLRTEATLAHARRFFADTSFEVPKPKGDAPPLDFSKATDSIADYVAYLFLDFAMTDHDIEDIALAHVAALASEFGMAPSFRKVAKKELKLTAAAVAELETRGRRDLTAAEVAP